MRRIEEKIGESKAADQIQEDSWFDIVMKELNDISKEVAIELQKETGALWNKGNYKLELYETPPVRLLALEIAIASWLGWIMHEKHGDGDDLFSTQDCWKRIEEAYLYGIELSKKKQRP
jgi:hypothetical protein